LTVQKIRDLASKAMQNTWFAYGSILLLQLKIVWGAWLLRDLTGGDTSVYFVPAWDWYRGMHVRMAWSPLYTSFYGTLLHFSTDAYFATILHRIVTVLVLSVLILALMRRLLPPGIAWLMTAWWVALPIDFDALYEVHLFALIPIVAAFLTILWKPGPWGRGCGLAILLATAFLMRNELLLATLLFAALTLGWDLRQKHSGLRRAYGIPLAVACLAVLFFYARSDDALHGVTLRRKHTLNICQVYAFGYQQRSSGWKGSPWLECQQLMTQVYGAPEPSLGEALWSNPRAMLEHFRWNLHLVPNGIQVLLFNSMSGSVTPDYLPVPIRPKAALAASLFALAITAVGLVILWSHREHWWKFWLKERVWAWVAMACVASVVMIVMIVERPRPSYMFSLGLTLRAVVGMGLFAVVRRFPRLNQLGPAMPAAIVVAILLAPCYYYVTNPGRVRPLLDIYWRLAPFQSRLENRGAGLAAIRSFELCNYLGKSGFLGRSAACQPLDINALRLEVTAETPWDKILARYGATLFYADDGVMADSLGRQFVSDADSHGWHTLALHSEPGQNWAVLERTGAPAVLALATDIVAPIAGSHSVRVGTSLKSSEASASAGQIMTRKSSYSDRILLRFRF
jgi:hypothetical protein